MPKRLEALIRYGLLLANGAATRALALLAMQASRLQISIDRIGAIDIAPLIDIPVPSIDLAAHDDPVPVILGDPRYRDTVEYFTRHASQERSLLSFDAQALLHVLARNLRPDHIIEVGVFKAATTEALARALYANGRGVIHAIDPFRSEYIAAIFKRWPAPLTAHLKFDARDSVQFFAALRRGDIHASLVFIDGNHDYEFASFDIESAARIVTAGGFIAVDNIAQPGPFLAVRDFLERHPGWIECGGSTANFDTTKAYDRDRTRIHNTDLAILRAPSRLTISERPWSAGQRLTSRGHVTGLRLELGAPSSTGTLHVQIVLRGFGTQQAEIAATASVHLNETSGAVHVPFAHPLTLGGEFTHFTVEPIVSWQGPQPLRLAREPELL